MNMMNLLLAQTEVVETGLLKTVESVFSGGTFGLLVFIIVYVLYKFPEWQKVRRDHEDKLMATVSSDRHNGNDTINNLSIRMALENEKQRLHDHECLKNERAACERHFDKISDSMEKSNQVTAIALDKLNDSHLLLADVIKTVGVMARKDGNV